MPNYLHFTTRINMAENIKIGLNNNLITNSSYRKFRGMTMNVALSWNNHIDLSMKKLSTACYITRNAKTHVCLLIGNNLSSFYGFFWVIPRRLNFIIDLRYFRAHKTHRPIRSTVIFCWKF
jgi:hypothetical protein